MNAVDLQHVHARWHSSGTEVLRNITAQAPRGQWTAIVGPNGAGKSTLLKAIAGLLGHDAAVRGEIQVQGQAPRNWTPSEWARHHAWLGQAEQGGEAMRAIDVVRLGRIPHQGWWPQAPSREDETAVREAMRTTECWALRDTPLLAMSGGERQRVRLARVLAVQASLLLMDEPLANLDPPHQADWLEQVHGLTRQGRSVISVLHELNIALRADHLWLVHEGELLAQGHVDDAEVRKAIVETFDGRIRLHALDQQWVALPVVRA